MKDVNYMHPVQGEFNPSDFRITDSGVTPSGVRIQSFEAQHPRVSPAYKRGFLVEQPNGQTTVAYGDYETVNALTGQLKDDPEKVFRSLKPLAPGTQFYLNDQPSQPMRVEPNEHALKEYETNKKLYPSTDEFTLKTKPQEEQQALKTHLKKTMTKNSSHPFAASNEEEQQRINEVVDGTIGEKPTALGA